MAHNTRSGAPPLSDFLMQLEDYNPTVSRLLCSFLLSNWDSTQIFIK